MDILLASWCGLLSHYSAQLSMWHVHARGETFAPQGAEILCGGCDVVTEKKRRPAVVSQLNLFSLAAIGYTRQS
jgi:hypothetical protein